MALEFKLILYSGKPFTHTYNGKKFKRYLGNFWSRNKPVIDNDGDGICDNSYHPLKGFEDRYPLAKLLKYYIVERLSPIEVKTPTPPREYKPSTTTTPSTTATPSTTTTKLETTKPTTLTLSTTTTTTIAPITTTPITTISTPTMTTAITPTTTTTTGVGRPFGLEPMYMLAVLIAIVVIASIALALKKRK